MTRRDRIKNKYHGKCAYTGRPLDDKWQIDHIRSKAMGGSDEDHNLVPAIRIINHYKRSQDLDMFRQFISTLHLRLRKLPKNTVVKRTIARAEYIRHVAELFNISENQPFEGKFYFEQIKL